MTYLCQSVKLIQHVLVFFFKDRLFIQMGDLYRYAESFGKAESYYLNASRLAPGMGNPYNQLAVVSQMKDANLSCVALYWYCRSLLATHDSFETSNSNLERLFDVNRTYLDEHSRDSSPPIFAPNKKTASDMLRAQKAAATKACLAHFVDFHHEVFQKPPAGTNEMNSMETRLIEKMDGVIRSLDSLLQASAFSDSLLVKMVVICTFSIERACENVQSIVAEDFLLRLGTRLSERLLVGVAKILKSGKQQSSIRLLLPLSILLEYVGHRDFHSRNAPCRMDFWERLASVATSLRQLHSHMATSASSDHTKGGVELKEFKMLKGFKPMSFLFPSYVSEIPFVDAEEAISVLDLQPTQSQSSTKLGSRDDILERLGRFVTTCDVCVAKSDIPLGLQNDKYTYHQPVAQREVQPPSTETPASMLTNESSGTMDVDDAAAVPMDDDSEAGDIVVNLEQTSSRDVDSSLRTTATSSKKEPPTLPMGGSMGSRQVPGIVLHENLRTADQPNPSPLITAAGIAPPPVAVQPPPGFGMSSAPTFPPPPPVPPPIANGSRILPSGDSAVRMTFNPFLQPSHYDNNNVLPMNAMITGPPSNIFPMQAAYIYPPNEQQQQPHQYHHLPLVTGQPYPVLGQSIDFLGGSALLRTNNPFESSPLMAGGGASVANNQPAWQHNNGMYSQSTSMILPNTTTTEDTSMLGAGLLESLFMSDPGERETKNPFAG
jgi:hypothetical protein